ncbi:unknown [Bacteroides sp. CAG:1060]|nr:unknown [Bacteroides sp. CAG:1060]
MSEILIKEGLTNIWTFHLTSASVLITIITVLYSFVLNKREQLIFYINESKTLKNPNVSRKRHLHQKYISKVKQIISFCFSLLVVSILVCATSILTIRIHINEIIYYILLGVTVIWLILAAVLAIMLTIQYKKDTKV